MKKIAVFVLACIVSCNVWSAAYDGCMRMLLSNMVVPIATTSDLTTVATPIHIRDMRNGALYLYVKGDNAGCALNVTFYFQRSPDGGTTWYDLTPLVVTLSGTSQILDASTNKDLDFSTTDWFRLARVTNAEIERDRTVTINAYIKLYMEKQ